MKFLIIDSETGGLNPAKNSILSLAGVIWKNNTPVDVCDILICESNINVEPEAMKINKLDVNRIKAEGVSPIRAAQTFNAFLERNFGVVDKYNKIGLVGQNIGFDIGFLKRLYRQARIPHFYEQRFSHRTLDTAGIMRFLYLAGKIPFKDASLDSAIRHFNIKVNGRHSALGDAIATG
jgi:DNA polymerase-3 subunit epsilon